MSAYLEPVHELNLCVPSPLEELSDNRLSTRGVRLLLKRDDLIHPQIPGNKWRKLVPNLIAARKQNKKTLMTFGGAYSNQVLAVAAAGHYFGFQTTAVVRSEVHSPFNEILRAATNFGMQLTFYDRTTYQETVTPTSIEQYRRRFRELYILPEGGSNALASKGCAEIPGEISEPFDVMCCAVVTGGMIAGISRGLTGDQHALGFAVIEDDDFLVDDVGALQQAAFGKVFANWSIETEFHFGGFGKRTPALDIFIDDFEQRHGLHLNWVYEAKMLFGLYSLIEAGRFEPDTTIVAVLAE